MEGACVALIMNTFHFLHGGNWFFANDTSFPIGSIRIQGQRGLCELSGGEPGIIIQSVLALLYL